MIPIATKENIDDQSKEDQYSYIRDPALNLMKEHPLGEAMWLEIYNKMGKINNNNENDFNIGN